MFSSLCRSVVWVMVIQLILAPVEYQAMANPRPTQDEVEGRILEVSRNLEDGLKDRGIEIRDSAGRTVKVSDVMSNPGNRYSLIQSGAVANRDLSISFQSKKKTGADASSLPVILFKAELSGKEGAIARMTVNLDRAMNEQNAIAFNGELQRNLQTFQRKISAEVDKAGKELNASLLNRTMNILNSLFGIPSAHAKEGFFDYLIGGALVLSILGTLWTVAMLAKALGKKDGSATGFGWGLFVMFFVDSAFFQALDDRMKKAEKAEAEEKELREQNLGRGQQ